MKIVFENDEVVLFYLRIGRVGVLDINRAVCERAVTERVIDTDEVLLRKPVTFAQRLPAVPPI